MDLSFVVVNKDDRRVAETLEALEHIRSRCPWSTETVVIDASKGRLDDIARRFTDVRWIGFPARTDKTTIAEQRNLGVARSEGEVVVFIDAGCVPYPGWLPALVEPLMGEGELICTGGHRSAGRRSLRDEAAHFIGTSRYVDQSSTLNLAVHRSVFDRLGGFDERFAYGSDLDFTWRAVEHGLRIRLVREAVVAHDWGGPRDELRRSFRYGRALHRLYVKHPKRRQAIWREDLVSVAYPLFLLVAPFAVVAPEVLLLLLIPMAKNLRHRPVLSVVDHLVAAAGILDGAWRARAGRAPVAE